MKIWMLCLFIICSTLVHASKIAVVTMAIGKKYQEAVAVSTENKRAYCERHGYDFILLEESLDLSRPIPWSKIPLIQQVLDTNQYDWVFWTDADSLIMNFNIPLESFVDDAYDFIITKDCFGGINSGQFFLKNCAWSKQFLKDVYAHTECINNSLWEQKAVNVEYDRPEVSSHTKVCQQRAFNSYLLELSRESPGKFQEGDFVIHFIAMRNLDALKKLLETFSEKVIQ